MKVYMFWLKDGEYRSPFLDDFCNYSERKITKSGNMAHLYAYTNSKFYRDKFISMRNMNLFILTKINIESSDYEKFKVEFGQEFEINMFDFETRGNSENLYTTYVLSTWFEHTSYQDSEEYIDDILCEIGYKRIDIEMILGCLKTPIKKAINIDNFIRVKEISMSMICGEAIFTPIDGLFYLIDTFGETFK